MRRREFLRVFGGAAAAWPLAAHAQQTDPMRRIGVLTAATAADDSDGQVRIAAFLQVLRQLGWIDGRNVQIDYRWGLGDANNIRRYAVERWHREHGAARIR